LPDSHLVTSISSDVYYEIKNFNVADMLCRNTIDGYINIGELFCISKDYFQNNIRFTLSEKKMKLSIAREAYLSLGAVHLRQFQKSVKDDFHHFEIDLSYKQLDKLRSELRSDLLDKVTIHFKWNSSEEVCPSSIAKYFTDMKYSVEAHRSKTKIESLYGLKLPSIPCELDTTEDDGEELRNFSELIGMILLRCDIEDNKCSSYEISNDKIIDVGRGKLFHMKGFLTSLELERIYKMCDEVLSESSLPYIAMTVINYPDCASRTIIVTSENVFVIQ
jgi:hypothetical protein